MTLAVMDVALDELDEDRSVAEALEGTVAAENAIEQELQALMEILVVSARDRVGWLEVLSRSTVGIKSHVSELQGTVSVAARKAEKVASRVRVLDASFQRCETALQRVEDVLALRTCAEGVRNALEHSDLETACGHVAKYLSLDEAARAEFNAESGAFASVSQVNESIADLTRAIRERADRAAEKDSVQEVANAVKLFVPIGLAEEGLERFAEYLKGVVHRESQEDVNALLLEQTETVEEEPHVMCLTRLFETVAGYLDASEDAIVESFGSLAFIRVVENLQQQCDSEAISILSRYTQERRLDEYSRLIGHRSVEARTLVPLLDEQAVISQRTMRYFAFLTNCAQTTLQQEKDAQIVSTSSMVSATGLAEDAEGEGRTPRPMNSNTMRTPKEEKTEPSAFDLVQHEFAVSLRECGLQKAVEELTTRYISMEAYFMQENVLKAIRIDEAPPLGSNEKTSTAVDEVFYFLEYSVRRAVTYANVVTLCAVINYANLAISTELLDFVKRRLRETHPALDKLSSYASGTPLKGLMLAEKSTKHGEEFRSPYGFTVALNNAQVSSDYSLRLRGQVEKSANEAFTTPRDHAQINAVLAQLSESSRSLAASAEASLTSLGTALTSRLRDAVSSLILLRPDLRADPPFFPPTTMDALSSVSYLLGEAEYQDQDRVDRFMQVFLHSIERHALSDLEMYLTESNWDGLVRRLAEWSARIIETALLDNGTNQPTKRFNALGALQLSRDVRALSTFFAGNSRRGTVRDVFARLNQISVLVNFENPAEIYDLWGPNSGGMTWRLTPSEVRKALALRVDFNAEAIRALRL